MGRDKGLLKFGGVPLVVLTARLIEPLVREMTVIGPPRKYSPLGLRAVSDLNLGIRKGRGRSGGPLIGIATALSMTRSPWNLVVSCDLPYLTWEWLDWLVARALASKAQILMPRTAGGPEPLAAVYRKECAAPVVAALKGGVRKVTDALAGIRIEYVAESEWSGFDPGARVLKNMNTRADYREAKIWWNSRTKKRPSRPRRKSSHREQS
jgi:molybdopterin-guanine dinucleotide biosynthesis protein A